MLLYNDIDRITADRIQAELLANGIDRLLKDNISDTDSDSDSDRVTADRIEAELLTVDQRKIDRRKAELLAVAIKSQ